jgi:exopolysaccharide production protein ExoZ
MRRAGRIAPLYWLVILVVAAVHMLWPAMLPPAQLAPSHVIQSALFLPHRDAFGGAAPVVVQGWALNYEAFFYVVFAISLLLPKGRRSAALTAALGGLCLAGLLAPHGRWAAFDAYTDPLILEFAAGVWLAKAAAGGLLGRTWQALAAIGGGIAILAVVAAIGVRAEGWARLACFGLPALAIIWGAVSLEGCGRMRTLVPLKSLGDASYSLYLTQGLALWLALALLDGSGLSIAIEMAVALGLALVFGLLCHHLVERPLLTVFHGRRGRRAVLRVRTVSGALLRAKAQS